MQKEPIQTKAVRAAGYRCGAAGQARTCGADGLGTRWMGARDLRLSGAGGPRLGDPATVLRWSPGVCGQGHKELTLPRPPHAVPWVVISL